jgi:hypothetical protein
MRVLLSVVGVTVKVVLQSGQMKSAHQTGDRAGQIECMCNSGQGRVSCWWGDEAVLIEQSGVA